MHASSYKAMERNIEEYVSTDTILRIADLGSLDVNGSYRALFPPNVEYSGVDLSPGENVDIVMPEEYLIPVPTGFFDMLVSGQCFEHVKNPFKLMSEVRRVVAIDGLVMLTAPFIFPEHRYPVDCWRFMSDGWQTLFDENGIEMVKTEYVPGKKGRSDCWAIGRIRDQS